MIYKEIVIAGKLLLLSSDCDLRLMSVDTADALVNEGSKLIIVALVGSNLHIRIFDANGERIVDKTENQLIKGGTLNALKKQLKRLSDESGLSQKQKKKIIENVILITIPARVLAAAVVATHPFSAAYSLIGLIPGLSSLVVTGLISLLPGDSTTDAPPPKESDKTKK